jgi:hypothetical protein
MGRESPAKREFGKISGQNANYLMRIAVLKMFSNGKSAGIQLERLERRRQCLRKVLTANALSI